MQWLWWLTVGVVIGLAAGWTAGRMPVTPLAQSVGAFLVALAAGNELALWWELRHDRSSYWGFGVENVLCLAILGLTAAVLHIGLDRVGAQWFHPLGDHLPLLLGCLGGVWGTLLMACPVEVA
jgi:hypothetical protein